MCTIAILIGVTGPPVVIAANRDELYARDTQPIQLLEPGVVGGRDAQSGGTWLAVQRSGQFAAVTNQRALAQPIAGVRSRGLAVRELAAAPDQDAYVAALEPRDYASMNLVWGSAERVSIAYLRHDGGKHVFTLPRGVHVLCNDRLESADFPRADRLVRAIDAALADAPAWDVLVPRLTRALADHARVPLADVPASPQLPAELARELTATCIHSEHYGTRSSTIAAFERGRVAAFLHADGPPCTTPLTDRKELLA
jgi:uncharacterized protein with NRDE domain